MEVGCEGGLRLAGTLGINIRKKRRAAGLNK